MRFPVHGRRLPLFAALLLSTGLSARAATLTVTNLNDGGDGSLRKTVALAASGDTIVFAPDLTGTIIMTGGQLSIGKTLTIVGPGANRLALDGNGSNRHLAISSTGNLTASGLTFSHGSMYFIGASAGSISNAGRLELRQCTLSDNTVSGNGGASAGCISSTNATLITVDCHFLRNTCSGIPYGPSSASATASGGAISFSGTAEFTNTTFESNSVTATAPVTSSASGGAISGSGTLTFTNCSFLSNTASAQNVGGGALAINSGTLTMRDTSLIGNTASGHPVYSGGYPSAPGSGNGGALSYGGSAARLTNCTFYHNQATGTAGVAGSGGGAISTGGSLVAYSCTVADNFTTTSGSCAGIAGGSNGGVELGSTIVAGNSNAAGSLDVSGAFTSDGYNLIGTVGSATGFTGPNEQLGTDATPIDPLLGDLTYSGGLGPTLAPRYGSPALDRGHDFPGLSLDQRGYFRTRDLVNAPNVEGSDTTDIGAVEVETLFVKADFNKDGTSDILWQNTQTGRRDVWTLRDTALYQVTTVANVATEWQNAAVGDMDGDGQEDFLWQNTRTGQRDIWLMQGVTLRQVVHLPTVDVAWEIAGVGDFDADGQNDIVWQNSQTGERDLWLMDGVNLRRVVHLPTVDLQWHIAAVGDVDGDGFSDLIWENTQTGEHDVWLLREASLASVFHWPYVDLEWKIVGTGDFNNDGRTDLVWQNTQTGDRDIWLLGNGTYQAVRLATVGLEWSIANH